MLGVIVACMQDMSSYMFGQWDTPLMVLIFFRSEERRVRKEC